MGEPRTPSPQDRTATRHLAARILQSIRDDEEMALGLEEVTTGDRAYYRRSDVEDLVASLAQEVCALEVSCGLAETRERQASEMCTWLTAENQRLRDALKDSKP